MRPKHPIDSDAGHDDWENDAKESDELFQAVAVEVCPPVNNEDEDVDRQLNDSGDLVCSLENMGEVGDQEEREPHASGENHPERTVFHCYSTSEVWWIIFLKPVKVKDWGGFFSGMRKEK